MKEKLTWTDNCCICRDCQFRSLGPDCTPLVWRLWADLARAIWRWTEKKMAWTGPTSRCSPSTSRSHILGSHIAASEGPRGSEDHPPPCTGAGIVGLPTPALNPCSSLTVEPTSSPLMPGDTRHRACHRKQSPCWLGSPSCFAVIQPGLQVSVKILPGIALRDQWRCTVLISPSIVCGRAYFDVERLWMDRS